MVELEGLEPSKPGSEAGQYEVANKQGTTNEFGYTWSLVDKDKGVEWEWIEGPVISFSSGSISRTQANTDGGDLDFGDDPPYPNKAIAILDNTHFDYELKAKFKEGILAGTVGGANGGIVLYNHFISGEGKSIFFISGGPTSNEVRNNSRFIAFANNFEAALQNYYKLNSTIVGFDGTTLVSQHPHFNGVRNNMYLATLMGGVQGVKTDIRVVNSKEIHVNYSFYDVFGAGNNDADRWQFRGLQAMYVLQHYRNVDKKDSKLYQPFFWGINVNR